MTTSKTIEMFRNLKIYTDLSDLEAISGYLEADAVCFDIETHTQPKPHWEGHDVKKFGVSVLSPPREVALYADDCPPVVLDFEDFDPYTEESISEQHLEQIEWLKSVLCRPGIMTIGHNVVFDWRNIGVHFDMMPHDDSYVWDTRVMAIRMGLGMQHHRKSPLSNGFDLSTLAQRLGFLRYGTELYEFYDWMKQQRIDLSNVDQSMLEEDESHIIWQIVGGFVPPNRPDLLKKSAKRLVELYAATDAAFTYKIYAKQLTIAEVLKEKDYILKWKEAIGSGDKLRIQDGTFKYPKYPDLTEGDISPHFKSQIDFVTRLMRVKCKQAIRGYPVDMDYLDKTINELSEELETLRFEVLDKDDPHDPYPQFEDIFATVMYFKQITDSASEEKTIFSNPKNWHYWSPIEVSMTVIEDALTWDENIPVSAESKQEWVNFFHKEALKIVEADSGTGRSIKGATLNAMPKTPPPTIDLLAWVERNCFHDKDDELRYFLARIKTEWLEYYYTITDNTVINAGIDRLYEMIEMSDRKLRFDRDYLREELPKTNRSMNADVREYCLEMGKIAMREEKFINMAKWKPYYMYCIASAPLPSSEELKYNSGLTTKRFIDAVKDYRSTHNGDDPDYQKLALKHWCFSYGKQAMDFFIGDDSAYADMVPELEPMRRLVQVRADLAMMEEIYGHARLTGKVHSMTVPDARTTRMTSKSPNMQNKKFAKGSPIIGVFVAPDGMTAFECDGGSIEVMFSNLIAKDHVGAKTREGTDIHMRRAEIYWSDEWGNLSNEEKAKYRQMSKRVTFGDLYAAGAYLIATQIGVSVQVAYEVMDKLHKALWRTEEKKNEVASNCLARYNAGSNPPFVTNWANSRIYVPLTKDWHSDNLTPLTYTTWNYVVQSSVPDMLGRAMVLIDEWLSAAGYNTYIAHEVHDALIIHFDDDEFLQPELFEEDIAVEIVKIFCNQIPERFLRRTTPKTHMIASLCPTNRFKWGYRDGVDYPYPTDVFVNQWGRFELTEEDEGEAPDWFGPLHEGWTLEKETEEIRREEQRSDLIETVGDGEVAEIDDGDHWYELNDLLVDYETDNMAVRNAIRLLLRPYKLSYNNGEEETGKMLFPVYMEAARALFHRGSSDVYATRMKIIQSIIASDIDTFGEWFEENHHLFNVLSEGVA